jgi:serine phosphatase RsbU (regulator of sigma subunit)
MLGLLEGAVESGSTIDISVEAGDRVLLYTDGFTESFDSEQQMLGVNGLRRIVGEVSSLPLATMKDEIVNRVNDWRSGPPADDMSLILLETQ